MLLVVIERDGRYLKSELDGQPLEWTEDIVEAQHYGSAGYNHALELARACGGKVISRDVFMNTRKERK